MAVDVRALVGGRTGIGVYTEALLARLLDEPDLGFVAMAHRPPEGIETLAARGLRCETQAAPLGILWQQLRLPRRLARGDVDLLWSPLFTLPLFLPVPAVVTVHDLTPVLLPRAHRWKTRWTIRPFLARSLARARRVVAVSEATAADLRRLYPRCAERLTVIHNGVDPEFRPAAPEAIRATRAELHCPRGFVLYAGTLEPRKNLGGLLDAWQELRRRGAADLPLVLAGPYGWGSRELTDRLAALAGEGVLYLGPLP
ncbi:MAG: glycosyltransferase family 4 protein, partial [Thermoanaerobaculia bacterium]